MKTSLSLLPDARTLTHRLTAALTGDTAGRRPVRILKRQLPRMICTYPNEDVACRLPNGRHRRVFIKYEAGRGHNSYGHRGNLAYEAEVYRRVLQALPGFRPKC